MGGIIEGYYMSKNVRLSMNVRTLREVAPPPLPTHRFGNSSLGAPLARGTPHITTTTNPIPCAQLQAGLTAMLYAKSLRINHNVSKGEVLTLVSTDVSRMKDLAENVHFVVRSRQCRHTTTLLC